MYGYEGKENWEREQLPDKLSRSSTDLVLHGLESILGLGYNITIFWAISNINKTRIDMAVQWLPTAIIIFFAYMIIFGGVIGTIFKKRDMPYLYCADLCSHVYDPKCI